MRLKNRKSLSVTDGREKIDALGQDFKKVNGIRLKFDPLGKTEIACGSIYQMIPIG